MVKSKACREGVCAALRALAGKAFWIEPTEKPGWRFGDSERCRNCCVEPLWNSAAVNRRVRVNAPLLVSGQFIESFVKCRKFTRGRVVFFICNREVSCHLGAY